MRRLLTILLPFALVACEEDEADGIDVFAFETTATQVRVTVTNNTDRDVLIAACTGGIYAILERQVYDTYARENHWTFESYVNGNCDVTGDTGYGLSPGAELEFEVTLPPNPARYRIVVFRMLDTELDPELEPIPSNSFQS